MIPHKTNNVPSNKITIGAIKIKMQNCRTVKMKRNLPSSAKYDEYLK